MSKSVDVSGFGRFLDTQSTQISVAYTEIEQLQAEYQGAYLRFRAEHDKVLYALAGQIEEGANGTGKSLSAQIEARARAEEPLIVKQIDELKSQLDRLQTEADEVLARIQQANAKRREMNPKLNEREENLKSDVARQQQTLNDLNTQISQLSRGLGLLRHSVKILALDRERWKTLGRLEQLEEELHKVRLDWKNLAARTMKDEADWKAQWQQKTLQLSQVRQQYDYLTQNTPAEARHRATVYVVDNLKTLPDEGEAAALQPMIDLNVQTDNFQAALGSVSEILGTLTGVREGVKRFKASLHSIDAEQQQHSDYLAPLHFQLSDDVLAFGQTWDDLTAKTNDEKALAIHPADFVAAMRSFMDERLSSDRITQFFNALGAALNAATRSWKSS
jgi:hypothetical protein